MPSPRPVFLSLTPLVPTGVSLTEALAFYTKQLGFSVIWQGGSMAGIARNGVAINLIENTNKEWIENASFSIGVSDLDALYDEYQSADVQVGPLEQKPWGRREFHLIFAGVCIQFFGAKQQ